MVSQSQGDIEKSPRILTSKRRIKYRESTWNVHKFDICSVEVVCKVVVLKVEGALFIWLGSSGSVEPELGELALGVPARGAARGGLAAALLGGEGRAAALARRLAARLARPVYVSSSFGFDSFNVSLVERGLIMEITNKTELYDL